MTSSPSARQYRDLILVLRTQDLGEADRIVTALSREHGIVRAVAKGIRKSTSRVGARLEPFMLTDAALARGRNLDTVVQAVTRKAYSAALVADFDLWSTTCALAEVAEHLAQGDAESARGLFELTAGAVSSLARGTHAPEDVLTSFLARAVALSGWRFETDACVRCGDTAGLNSWSLSDGGVVCAACRRAGDLNLAAEERAYLSAVSHGRWEDVDEQAAQRVRGRAGRILRRYVQWHAEKNFRSFAMLEGS